MRPSNPEPFRRAPSLRWSSVRLFPVLAMLLLTGQSVEAGAGVATSYLYWAVNGDPSGVPQSEIWRSTVDGAERELFLREELARGAVVDPTNGHLYFSMEDGAGLSSIVRSDLLGNGRQVLVSGQPGNIYDIELDLTGGKFYWAVNQNSVRRANLDGSGVEILTAASNGGLALDLVAGRMYYSGDAFAAEIRRANLDGSNDVVLTTIGNSNDLEVDASNGWLYVAVGQVGAGVRRCDLDGQGCTVIIGPAASELEVHGGFLYYMDIGARNLSRAGLDGSNPEPVSSGINVPNYLALDGDAGHLYLADGILLRTDLNGSNPTPLASLFGDELHDVAVDPVSERVFVGDAEINAISLAPIDRPGAARPVAASQAFRSATADVRGMAVDPLSGLLYWANVGSAGGIWRIAPDGSGLLEIVPAIADPHDVALDSMNGKIYWTEAIGSGSSPTALIRRSNFDGTAVENVLTGLPQSIRGIAVDDVNGKLYWTDHGTDQLMRADLDGTNVEALPVTVVNPHDIAVDPAAGRIYWTEGTSGSAGSNGKIRSALLDGTSPQDVHTGLSSTIRDLTIVSHRFLPLFGDGFE